MIIKKINEKLSITGEVYSNSRAWGHEVKAIYNGQEVAKNRIRYYNKTWEGYQFARAWLGLVGILDKTKAIPLKDRLEMARIVRVGSGW
jgi:hypothetical protein